NWIAAGTPAPSEADLEVVSLEVTPKEATLKPGDTQQLSVTANYSNGSKADVTRWVKYSSSADGTATVDDNGKVKMAGHGEAAITLWFSSRVLYATVRAPYPNQIPAEVWTKASQRNYIDKHILAKLRALNIQPSGEVGDAGFLRRAWLDAAGVLPRPEEVEAFLADKSADKRAKLVDRILASDEYVDYWAYKWSDLMLVSSRKLRPTATRAFYSWIHAAVKANKPWDQFAREIFESSGSTRQNGALNYYVIHKDPIDLTENVTQAFLGQRLTCARCHNHPLEKWTQKQYYQMANLFSRVGLKNGTGEEQIVFAKAVGDINHPRLLKPLAPAPLDGDSMALESSDDRRVHFAKWLTSPKNEMFSRSVVNRVWGNFFGHGIVDPVDDVRATNPASNEDLFAAVNKDFVDNGFDVKRLIRTIMNSAAYQRSSESNATNGDDVRYFSKYNVKRLPAEVVLDTMASVTGVPTEFTDYPLGTRALQLPDTKVESRFLTAFGRPPRILCDAAERSSDPSISQALHVINGDTLNKKLSSKNGVVARLTELGFSDARILEYFTMAALSRYPAEEDTARVMTLISGERARGKGDSREVRKQVLEDMLWAMLTSKEFLFNY
ncbi:MAG: DUF1549 domain-containing protein, partial [Bryobacteraceae bacterium]|nr:DUF1549 domain-containing protein [Bryobacteraceae bacterium]